MLSEFSKLPLTAMQVPDETLDPGFSVPGMEIAMPSDNIDPGFSVMPDYSYPDYDIDPDFSVMPPMYPVYPPLRPTPSPTIPCLFCNNNQWIRGGIRLLNAATGYNAFMVMIDNRTVATGLHFPEITQYLQLSQGYHVFTIMDTNGYILLRKSLYIGDGMSTVAIINAPTGLDLTVIEDTACAAGYNLACFRVCNLAYYSGPVNAAIGNVYFNAIAFREAASFSRFEAGRYLLNVSRSMAPETTLVSTPVTLTSGRIYTAYVLNWNPSSDTIQTLLVEDRRN